MPHTLTNTQHLALIPSAQLGRVSMYCTHAPGSMLTAVHGFHNLYLRLSISPRFYRNRGTKTLNVLTQITAL